MRKSRNPQQPRGKFRSDDSGSSDEEWKPSRSSVTKSRKPSPSPALTKHEKKKRKRTPMLPLLLAALTPGPVRLIFHQFLGDRNAARLLRVSRKMSHELLTGYTFHSHVFELKGPHPKWVHNMKALYEMYKMGVQLLLLPLEMKRLQMEDGTSPLPSTLTVLAAGQMPEDDFDEAVPQAHHSVFGAKAAERMLLGLSSPWNQDVVGERDDQRYIRTLQSSRLWPDYQFEEIEDGVLRWTLPPGLLPPGLRVLQLSANVDIGSIPSTVEYLHGDFGEELTAGMLPSSLVHLVTGLGYCDASPLAAGVLPSSLECLQLGTAFDHPFVVGSLPSSLKVLELSSYNQPLLPGILPDSLTHLLLGDEFNHPLTAGVLPLGLISLHVGNSYDVTTPLHVGVLPTSLLDLHLGTRFAQRLLPGSLPAGLKFLRLSARHYSTPLGAGILPDSLVALDLRVGSQCMSTALIPASVRWLQVRERCRDVVDAIQLSPSTEVIWA